MTASVALEDPVEALDGRRPVIRPIPHVAILRDEFTQLFNDDFEEEEEEMEARGEHTLSEKFGGHFAALVNGTLCLEVFKINHTCWVYSCSVRVPARLVEYLSCAHRTRFRAQMRCLALPQPAHGAEGGCSAQTLRDAEAALGKAPHPQRFSLQSAWSTRSAPTAA